jgi:hypothetical protein
MLGAGDPVVTLDQPLVELSHRRGSYAKDPADEDFLAGMNDALQPLEAALYRERPIEYPFVFVAGAPRSGTTLLSQVLAYCLDVGYVTNIAARFWRAPVHGIRLSRVVAGDPRDMPFASDYARTPTPLGIHEFGYFWSSWLKKETFADVVHARAREDGIDWDGLRNVLANVQHEFGAPLVAKNILGTYHMPRLRDVLEQVLWVVIERDPLDACISILDARRRYYGGDESRWWSYVPPEYFELEGRGYAEQIAGQVHYLGKFYDRALAEVGGPSVKVRYEDLCASPASALDAVMGEIERAYGHRIELRQAPPPNFAFREYADRDTDKEMFAGLLDDLRRADA